MKKPSTSGTIILGIDPGFGRLGYGAILYTKKDISCVTYGCITTPAHSPLDERLFTIHTELSRLMMDIRPHRVAVEKELAGVDHNAGGRGANRRTCIGGDVHAAVRFARLAVENAP